MRPSPHGDVKQMSPTLFGPPGEVIRMRVKSVALLAVLALCALAPAMAARAEEWIVTPGVRFRIKPPYEGADNHVISVLPALTIRPAQRDYRFNPPDGGASLSLIDTTLLVAGPVVRFRGSRGDDGKLTGLTRIPVATEPGAFVALWPTPWLRARVEARPRAGWCRSGTGTLPRPAG